MKLTPEPPFTVEEFAQQVRRDVHTVRRWRREGLIVSDKIMGKILIPRSEYQRIASGVAMPTKGPKPGSKRSATIRQKPL